VHADARPSGRSSSVPAPPTGVAITTRTRTCGPGSSRCAAGPADRNGGIARQPGHPADAKGLRAAAIRDDDPVLVLENLASTTPRARSPTESTSRGSAMPRCSSRPATSPSSATRGPR
jgi:hypothetical protein